jgi:hypothetical protein
LSAPAVLSRLTAYRVELSGVLDAGGTFDVVLEPGGWSTLPALVIQAATPWITLEQGPKRIGRLALNVGAFVRQVDAASTYAALEAVVEAIFLRLSDAPAWRVDYVAAPLYITEKDQAVLSSSLTVSRPYPVPSTT